MSGKINLKTFITAAILSLTALVCALSFIILLLMMIPVEWIPESSFLVFGVILRNLATFLWGIQLVLAPVIIATISVLILVEIFILISEYCRRFKRRKW